MFPKDYDVFKHFSSSKSEKPLEDGTKHTNGVVMEGSAVGMLVKLPKFQLINFLMNFFLQIACRQYMVRLSKSRKFIYAIVISAKNDDRRDCFNVPFHGDLWDNCFTFIERFFESNTDVSHDSDVASKFVWSTFELI